MLCKEGKYTELKQRQPKLFLINTCVAPKFNVFFLMFLKTWSIAGSLVHVHNGFCKYCIVCYHKMKSPTADSGLGLITARRRNLCSSGRLTFIICAYVRSEVVWSSGGGRSPLFSTCIFCFIFTRGLWGELEEWLHQLNFILTYCYQHKLN